MVECVEKRERIDEARFAIDLEAVNVAGTNKVSSHSYQSIRICYLRSCYLIDVDDL